MCGVYQAQSHPATIQNRRFAQSPTEALINRSPNNKRRVRCQHTKIAVAVRLLRWRQGGAVVCFDADTGVHRGIKNPVVASTGKLASQLP